MSKLFAQFEDALIRQDVSARTRNTYLSDLGLYKRWFKDAIGGKLKRATTANITAYRAFKQTYCEPSTVNRHIITLKRFYGWMQDAGIIKVNPAKPVKAVPEAPKAPRHLTATEEACLLEAAARHGSDRDIALLVVMFGTGLRAMEVCNLAVQDIHIGNEAGTLQVRAGKRNKYRTVPLNATVRRALAEYLAQRQAVSNYVFPNSRHGGRLGERGLGYIIGKYAALAGVEDVSPHDLRHRFAYKMAEHVPLQKLAIIMGHESIDTTMVYTRPTAADLQSAVERIV